MYIIYKYALNEIILFGFVSFWGFLRPWKLTFREHWMNFFCFCFFDDLLKLYFFYYMSQQNWWSGKKSIKSIFEGFFLSLKRKFWKFRNAIDSRYLEYSKNWTPYKPLLKAFQKWNYLTVPFWAKLIQRDLHSVTRTVVVFYQFSVLS